MSWLQTKDYWELGELEYKLAFEYDVVYESKQSYYDLFDAAGISWKKTTSLNPKADPDAVAAKKKEIETLLANNRSEIETGKLRVLLIDECHLMWGDAIGYVWGTIFPAQNGRAVSQPIVPQTNILNTRLGRFVRIYSRGKTDQQIAVPVVNERDKQTYYGAVDYRERELRTYCL